MNKNILYIFDETTQHNHARMEGQEETTLWLCPLTTDEQCIERVRTFYSSPKVKVECIPYLQEFHDKAFSLKNDFLKFISEFADAPRIKGKNLKEYFAVSSWSFSLWWTSLVAEKNPLKSHSYTHLISLVTVLEIIKRYQCGEVWSDVKSPGWSHALGKNLSANILWKDCRYLTPIPEVFYSILHLAKGIWRLVVLIWKNVVAKINFKEFRARIQQLRESRYLLVTYFPFLDEEALKKNRFINRFYGSLQASLEQKYKDEMSWLAVTVETDQHNFRQSIGLAQKINRIGKNLFFYEEFATAKDCLQIFWQYIVISVKFIFIKNEIRKSFRFAEEVYIWPFFRREWYSSFCGTRLIEGLFYYFCFSNVVKELGPQTTILYFAEMQAWEKVLIAAAKERNDLNIVGIQHAIVSVLHLMYFNNSFDLEKGNYIQKMPRPDYLACVGRIPLKLFRDSGWETSQSFSLGPIRFEHFRKHLDVQTAWGERTYDVVVALSISETETKEILSYVYQAFRDVRDVKIFIKSHPFCPMKKVFKDFEGKFDRAPFEFIDMPLQQLLPQTKILVVAESSAAIEGISCQCRIVIPRLANVIDMNPLSGVSDLPYFVYSPQELKKSIVEDLMPRQSEETFYLQRCREFIEKYCEFSDADDYILQRLETAVPK